MDISSILERQIIGSGNRRVVIEKVPTRKRPTVASIKCLEREISSQIRANEAMRSRSMQTSSK